MRFATILLVLSLVGSQTALAEPCCLPQLKKSTPCGGCGDSSPERSSPRPDCCTSVEASKDVEYVTPTDGVTDTFPATPVLVAIPELGIQSHPDIRTASHEAGLPEEGPPLYLHNSVLLI